MPFMRVDPDAYDEYAEELGEDVVGEKPSGGYEYESAEAVFDFAKLKPIGTAVLSSLREMGASAFRVRYDGGYDEGFAHADSLVIGDDSRPIEQAASELAAGSSVEKFREAIIAEWGGRSAQSMAKVTNLWLVNNALDSFAYELASRLLGGGYGTGEYSLYGAFTVDLATGEITDDPDAPKPDNME